MAKTSARKPARKTAPAPAKTALKKPATVAAVAPAPTPPANPQFTALMKRLGSIERDMALVLTKITEMSEMRTRGATA